ncbi:hypothetical protein SY88_02900 [Clostridiales bacterium PH28_bin88]|nr:hypothetical protein SY88_02900 [Clostridiales bacterium PH28_bin88]
MLIAGVGGQGTILASDILAEVGLQCGYDVKKSEVHGMSQRGGAVESHVRWSDKVYSPQIETGKVDFLLGFEMLEAARWAKVLAPGAVVLINRHRVSPPSVNLGMETYPGEGEIEKIISNRGGLVHWVEGTGIAQELGNQTLAGVVLLGRLSLMLDAPEEAWLSTISRLVPEKFIDLNVLAFKAGRKIFEAKGESICETSVS